MELTKIVSPREPIGRYLPEKSYFSRKHKAAKPKAFRPTHDLKLSVFRIDGLKAEEIWEIGQREVIDAMSIPKVLYGIAELRANKFQEKDLVIDPDNTPPRHANIIGWPEEEARCISIALELAAEANLRLKD